MAIATEAMLTNAQWHDELCSSIPAMVQTVCHLQNTAYQKAARNLQFQCIAALLQAYRAMQGWAHIKRAGKW